MSRQAAEHLPYFFVSVADKGLSDLLSTLETQIYGTSRQVLISKGFTVDAEAVVVIEVDGVGVAIWGGGWLMMARRGCCWVS